MKIKVPTPKPRAKRLNEVLMGRKGGAHVKETTRAAEKVELKKQLKDQGDA